MGVVFLENGGVDDRHPRRSCEEPTVGDEVS